MEMAVVAGEDDQRVLGVRSSSRRSGILPKSASSSSRLSAHSPCPLWPANSARQQLVAAARRVLGRDGVASGTLRAVAAEAGVPLGTVHYIFPSKEQLLRAVLEDVVDEVSRHLRNAASGTRDVEEATLTGARAAWSALVEAHPLQQLMQFELTIWALRTDGMTELARWQYQRYLEVLTDTWTRLADHAGVVYRVPAAEVARLQLAATDGLILQYLTDRDTERALADLDKLTRHLVRYAEPTPTTAAGTRRRSRRSQPASPASSPD
jgi:AcrR family transcriptional regulator